MSVDAKQLLRNGVLPQDLPKEVAGKGYYSESRQLDQVVDGEIHQMIAYIKKTPYLCLQRGKRRHPQIVPENDKYMRLEFPNAMPIPPDLNLDGTKIDTGDSSKKDDNENNDEEKFDF